MICGSNTTVVVTEFEELEGGMNLWLMYCSVVHIMLFNWKACIKYC